MRKREISACIVATMYLNVSKVYVARTQTHQKSAKLDADFAPSWYVH